MTTNKILAAYTIFTLMLLIALFNNELKAQVADTNPDTSKVVYFEKQPQPLNLVEVYKAIEYPEICREANIQGKVVVNLMINKEGVPEKHTILRSPHDILTKAVEAEIYKLRFKPEIHNNEPITFWVAIPFDFKLKNPEPAKKTK